MQIVVQALIRRVFAHKPRPLGRGGWLICAKGEGISGNKHDSNPSSGSNGTISNTDDETSGDTVNNAESMNGNTAKSGSKNNSLKTLPQTGTKDVTILEILGLFLSLFGLLGLKKKHHEE